jgi:hypothetical protein
MKRVYLAMVTALLMTPASLAETESCNAHTKHCYKEKVALKDELFDPTMDCGLNLAKLEDCIKADRSAGQGESFCNDVKLYAGNKKKLMEINASIKSNPASLPAQKKVIEMLSEVQRNYTHQFVEAGLQPEQIGMIPPINNFTCKKLAPRGNSAPNAK